MRTQYLFVFSALALVSCSKLTGQAIPVEQIQDALKKTPEVISNAKKTAADSIELGKMGLNEVKKSASGVKVTLDHATATAKELQQGAGKILDGVEQVRAATR